MRTLKAKTDKALAHGAAWFATAGISGGVCVWMLVEVIKSALERLN